MTGAWKSSAKVLLLATAIFAISLVCAGLWSVSHDVPQMLFVVLGVSCIGSLAAILGLALAYYAVISIRVYIHLRRATLSHKEFADLLNSCVKVDIGVVREVRQIARRHFSPLNAERFYPNDRLEDDLHLSDLLPVVAMPMFWRDLSTYLGYSKKDLMAAKGKIVTFGALVLLASRLLREKPPG
jgi:hypothetical protein